MYVKLHEIHNALNSQVFEMDHVHDLQGTNILRYDTMNLLFVSSLWLESCPARQGYW
jgi:hypothetical protein